MDAPKRCIDFIKKLQKKNSAGRNYTSLRLQWDSRSKPSTEKMVHRIIKNLPPFRIMKSYLTMWNGAVQQWCSATMMHRNIMVHRNITTMVVWLYVAPQHGRYGYVAPQQYGGLFKQGGVMRVREHRGGVEVMVHRTKQGKFIAIWQSD